MDNFPRIDVSALAKDLEVKRHAIEEGRRDRPDRNDTKLDSHQRAVTGAIDEMLNDARQTGEERMNHITVQLGGIDPVSMLSAVKNLPVDAELQVERAKGDIHDRLIKLRHGELAALRDFNAFQQANDLNRSADYPVSDILHWSIVAALVLSESIANSFFFAGGSDLGLLGGALQAMLISLVNVGAALIAGVYAFRNLHHVSPVRRYFAIAGIVVYAAFLIFFNFATAHYRAQLGIDPLTAIVEALASLIRSPFTINDFDAVVLLCVGVMFSIAAAIKGYLADDPYPGYGQHDRIVQDARHDYQMAKQELRAAINDLIDTSRDILQSFVTNARRASREFAKLVAEGDTLLSEYRRYTLELRQACHALLSQYRSINISVRTAQPPAYFDDYPPIDVDDDLPSADLGRYRERGGDFEKLQAEIERAASDTLAQLKDVNARALKDCETFFKLIEKEAQESFSTEAPNADEVDDA